MDSAPTGDLDQLLAELDRLRAQVESLQASLEHRERLATLGTIAGLIAHEFNNVLTPVRSYAQMALAAPEDRGLTGKALTRAMEGSDRAAQIAQAILGFVREERSENGGVGGRGAESCNVRRVVDEALGCLGRPLEKDGIRVEIVTPAELTAGVRGVALQHVVLNVILNARAAMLPGGGVLSVRARGVEGRPRMPVRVGVASSVECSTWNILNSRERGGGTWAEIEIRDTGRGMDEAGLGRLFVAFASGGGGGGGGERRRGGGTGLGMTICKRLLDDCGGVLVVESGVGRGTVARVWVPVLR